MEAKERICMTHGHELRKGTAGGNGGTSGGGQRGETATTIIINKTFKNIVVNQNEKVKNLCV